MAQHMVLFDPRMKVELHLIEVEFCFILVTRESNEALRKQHHSQHSMHYLFVIYTEGHG